MATKFQIIVILDENIEGVEEYLRKQYGDFIYLNEQNRVLSFNVDFKSLVSSKIPCLNQIKSYIMNNFHCFVIFILTYPGKAFDSFII